jgi:hypothetical protein
VSANELWELLREREIEGSETLERRKRVLMVGGTYSMRSNNNLINPRHQRENSGIRDEDDGDALGCKRFPSVVALDSFTVHVSKPMLVSSL